jgi:membrane protein implicated in regulation of membrane protease activity
MSFLDALTADAYPRDSQGRRVIAPYGRRGKAFVLPPERATEIALVQRRAYRLYVAALIAGGFIAPWAVLVVAVLTMVCVPLGFAYVTHGLEESTERPDHSREERVKRGLQAMGRPTMLVLCLGGAAMAIGAASLLLRGERSAAVWFLTIYGAIVAALYARRLGLAGTQPPAT